MALEASFNNLDDLVTTNPAATDLVTEGDDHLRGIKNAIRANVTGDATETRLKVAGSVVLTANTGGVVIQSTTANAALTLKDSAGNSLAQLVTSTDDLFLEPLQPGKDVTLRVRSGADAAENAVTCISDGAVTLYYDAGPRLATSAAGANVTGTSVDIAPGTDSQTRVNVRSTIGGASLQVVSGTATAQLRQTSSGGTSEDIWLQAVRNGAVSLYHNGTARLATTVDGADVTGTIVDLNNSAAATEASYRLRNSEGGAMLKIDGGQLSLRQTDADGSSNQESWIEGIRDGAVKLYHNGGLRIETTASGADVNGTLLEVVNAAATAALVKARNSEGGYNLQTDGANAQLYQTSAGGALQDLWLLCEANGAVTLYRNNVTMLRTADYTAADFGMGAEVKDGAGTFEPVGMNVTPIDDHGTNTDLRLANVGHQLRCTAAITVDVDVTTNNAKDGSKWEIVADGGDVSITFTGVTGTWLNGAGGATGTRTLADGSDAWITKRADGQYQIVGNGLT
jgi:hypothetical protein